jgi:hypothetical protein
MLLQGWAATGCRCRVLQAAEHALLSTIAARPNDSSPPRPNTLPHSLCPSPSLQQAKQAVEAAARAAAKAAKGDAPAALEDDSNEETDPTKYFENRVRAITAAKVRRRGVWRGGVGWGVRVHVCVCVQRQRH